MTTTQAEHSNLALRCREFSKHSGTRRILTIFPSSQCSFTITILTVFTSLNVRNPKPRERPDAPSLITVHSSTSPNCEKYSFSDSIHILDDIKKFFCPDLPSVVSQFNPPMNIFLQFEQLATSNLSGILQIVKE